MTISNWKPNSSGNLGPYAIARYRGTPPPDPPEEKIRPIHKVKVTARKPPASAPKKSPEVRPGDCDHSKFKAWAHDLFRVRCGGCKQAYPMPAGFVARGYVRAGKVAA